VHHSGSNLVDVQHCFSTGNIGGGGGIVGVNSFIHTSFYGTKVVNCYTTGLVSANCGGICADLSVGTCEVESCYVTGTTDDQQIGGTVTNSRVAAANTVGVWNKADATATILGQSAGIWKIPPSDTIPWKLNAHLNEASYNYDESTSTLTYYTNRFPINSFANAVKIG
jgi:hypothetical protein